MTSAIWALPSAMVGCRMRRMVSQGYRGVETSSSSVPPQTERTKNRMLVAKALLLRDIG